MVLRVGILTISDRASLGSREDLSGPAIKELVEEQKWHVAKSDVIPDDLETIKNTLINWADQHQLNLILTTGGTGFSPRDITPEATLAVIHRSAPGIAEAMRANSLRITPHAMLSRSVAGIRGHVLIVNLPGSPKAAIENLRFILPVLPHAVELLQESPSAEEGHLFKSK